MEANLFTAKFIAVGLALFVGSIFYDRLVGWLERTGRDRGYTALLVVIGTAVTLAGLAIVAGLDLALLAAGLFAFSGAPMLYGSVRRYQDSRAEDELRAKASISQRLGETNDDGQAKVGGLQLQARCVRHGDRQ